MEGGEVHVHEFLQIWIRKKNRAKAATKKQTQCSRVEKDKNLNLCAVIIRVGFITNVGRGNSQHDQKGK